MSKAFNEEVTSELGSWDDHLALRLLDVLSNPLKDDEEESLSLSSKSAEANEDEEETIQRLQCESAAIEKELQQLTDWSYKKVIQAAQRLGKEQPELKMLRQMKAEGSKLSQAATEIQRKRVAEMDQTLSNANLQLENARLDYNKANEVYSVLEKDIDAAKTKSERSTVKLGKCSNDLEETRKRVKSATLIKMSCQEELTALRNCKAGHLKQLQISRDREEQHEVLRRQDEVEKLKYYEDSTRKRSETERAREETNAKVDRMRERAERSTQKWEEEIKKLDAEIDRILSESPKPKPLDVHKNGGRSGFSSTSLGNLTASSSKAVVAAMRMPVFQGICGGKDDIDIMEPPATDRECSMCLSEDSCVVFMPCYHQVLCSECNAIHEECGMSDCPSCRQPIKTRFSVKYADA